jgi:hypothetical protein
VDVALRYVEGEKKEKEKAAIEIGEKKKNLLIVCFFFLSFLFEDHFACRCLYHIILHWSF